MDNSNQKKHNSIGKASLWQIACNHKHAGRYDTDEKEGERNENLVPEDFVDQMLALVDSGTYTYVPSNTICSPRKSILPPVTYVIPQKYEWEEVLDLLKEKYPEKPGLLKVDLSIRLWRKIMKLRAFSAESCMKCILAEKRV